jgi:magnesium-transporting ATPase (P-type)
MTPGKVPGFWFSTLFLDRQKEGIVSRLESIDEMAGREILCSDKTGTLTQ